MQTASMCDRDKVEQKSEVALDIGNPVAYIAALAS